MIPAWLSTPLRLLPQPMTAVSLGVTLNLFFQRHPELKERMTELGEKVFQFQVTDLEQEFYMLVAPDGEVKIHTYADQTPNVTMAGEAAAFLALLFQLEDPDSLFFSRRLKLSGETETGLRFKNILDNVEIDWENELAGLVGRPAAMVLAGMGRRVRQSWNKGREQAEEELEAWLEKEAVPRQEELEGIKSAAADLGARLERLERALSRIDRKLALQKKD